MPGELSEKDFIYEGYQKNPWPAWIFFFVLLVMLALGWTFSDWRAHWLAQQQENSSFLQVTNRQISLFLWSNPEFMRANVRAKADYLPGFRDDDKIHVIPALADEYVVVPPKVLFRYHIWKEFLAEDVPKRKISDQEFRTFLNDCEEWLPEYWQDAPEDYRAYVAGLSKTQPTLSDVPEDALPKEVRQAFIGWKNFYQEGELINQVRPTFAEARAFLLLHPFLARNYWRNILSSTTPDYLLALWQGKYDPDAVIPEKQLSYLFKVPYFNALMADEGK